ncbi:uncharacterized protein EV420DRAFT_1081735 [Desarmillaria tabescens]|uniref:Uncharacterized protein n=1 Tax=Armillaria tabescens TaxID=1929756 RepID=A0AA39JHZ4_ARMTA|nr:uncharacterized protein EV420DRAFT_1081735 [Desarmillaria tabescens]KAK0442305.1 hypothetical protein EV420DRAFT_1081735 [Desarmillaria tabescens]
MGDVAMGFAYLISCCCCCFSSDPGPEGSGLRYAKRDPREDLVDQEFRSRMYKKDKAGYIHMQPRSSSSTSAVFFKITLITGRSNVVLTFQPASDRSEKRQL